MAKVEPHIARFGENLVVSERNQSGIPTNGGRLCAKDGALLRSVKHEGAMRHAMYIAQTAQCENGLHRDCDRGPA